MKKQNENAVEMIEDEAMSEIEGLFKTYITDKIENKIKTEADGVNGNIENIENVINELPSLSSIEDAVKDKLDKWYDESFSDDIGGIRDNAAKTNNTVGAVKAETAEIKTNTANIAEEVKAIRAGMESIPSEEISNYIKSETDAIITVNKNIQSVSEKVTHVYDGCGDIKKSIMNSIKNISDRIADTKQTMEQTKASVQNVADILDGQNKRSDNIRESIEKTVNNNSEYIKNELRVQSENINALLPLIKELDNTNKELQRVRNDVSRQLIELYEKHNKLVAGALVLGAIDLILIAVVIVLNVLYII